MQYTFVDSVDADVDVVAMVTVAVREAQCHGRQQNGTRHDDTTKIHHSIVGTVDIC